MQNRRLPESKKTMRRPKRKTGYFEEIDLFAELEMHSGHEAEVKTDSSAAFSEPPKALPLSDSPEKPETVPKTLKISRRDEDFKLEALVKKPSAAPGFPKIIIRDRPREALDTAHDAGELIGMAQAAALLEVSEATVRNWVKLGRIVPAGQAGRKNVFRKKDILDLRDDIAGDAADSSLKRRRNKTRASGSGTYCSYITKNRTNLAAVDAITAAISCCASVFPLEKGRILLADAAVKMLHARGLSGCPDLLSWLNAGQEEPLTPLIRDLLPDSGAVRDFIRDCGALFRLPYEYEPGEDALGYLYLSILNIGDRKSTGTYYTPCHAVERLGAALPASCLNGTVLDPCAGTGNFLLNLPDTVPAAAVYGCDIDETAVKLLRINMALRFRTTDLSYLRGHFRVSDFLKDAQDRQYRVILGNPPWGYRFSDEDREFLRTRYRCVAGRVMESFALFIERSLECLESGGILSLVLPEAVLGVQIHAPVRELLVRSTSVRYLAALGDIFHGVQCPSVILELENTGKPMTTAGMRVETPEESFVIQENRPVSGTGFSFFMNDAAWRILDRLENCPSLVRLLGQADFALGIVTGDNKKHLCHAPGEGREIIVGGTMIFRYGMRPKNDYIVFRPGEFQQCARECYYRAPEKLIYRFISKELAFCYDCCGTLSLNSANIVVPKIPGLSVKYVMTVLNSRMAQFYFSRKFNSLKVLRNHIESIPIPAVPEAEQRVVTDLADRLISGAGMTQETAAAIYNDIDRRIADYYGLASGDYRIILEQIPGVRLLPPEAETGKHGRKE